MLRRKRGLALSLETLIELTLIAIVALFFISYVSTISSSSVFERSFLAKDMALLSNTVQSSPQDVALEYTSSKTTLANYDYAFTENFAQIITKKYDDTLNPIIPRELVISYPIFYNTNLGQILTPLNGPSKVALTNFNNVVTIGQEALISKTSAQQTTILDTSSSTDQNTQSTQFIKQNCANPSLEFSKIVLDTDSGFFNNGEFYEGQSNLARDQIESEITWKLISQLEYPLKSEQLTTKTRASYEQQQFTYETKLKTIGESNTLLIFKTYSAQQHTDNTIKIYYKPQSSHSKQLACSIHNAIVDTAQTLKITSQPVFIELNADQRNLELMNKAGIALRIDVGNIDLANNPLYTNTPQLITALNQGITNAAQ